jgi:hypothetical protein
MKERKKNLRNVTLDKKKLVCKVHDTVVELIAYH